MMDNRFFSAHVLSFPPVDTEVIQKLEVAIVKPERCVNFDDKYSW